MASAGAAIGATASYGIMEAVLSGSKFIDTMTFVKAIAKDTGVEFSALSKRAKTLGRDTMFTSLDIGSAMQYMAMAGQGTKEIYNNITAAADLANATMSELGGKGGAADIMTNIMKMFLIDSTQTNSTRVADVLTRAVTRSNTNLYDLGEAIKYAGTTTTNLGATLEQTAAAIGVLGDAGIQGSMAGTALANAYRYLAKSIGDPNFKGGKALAKLGLSKSDFVDAEGQLIDLGLAMQKIANAASSLGSLDQYNLLVNILGVRGERAGSTMIRAFQNYTNLLDELNTKSAGAAADVRTQRMASLAGAIETVQSTWENLITSFTESLAPTLTPWLRGLGKILEGIQYILDSPVGPFISALVTGTVVIGTIAASVTALKASFRLLFNDSTVSLRNMFMVMQQGWKSASISASQYAAIQSAINAQVKAGVFGKGVGGSMLYLSNLYANQGKYFGRIMGKEDKSGLMRYYMKNRKGGVTRISPELATRYGARFSPLAIMGGALGGAAAKGAMRFGATSILRGLVSFLGGPWGIALTAITTFLPMIVSAITKNGEKTEESNNLLRKLTPEEQRAENIKNANLTPEERDVAISQSIANLYSVLDRYGSQMNFMLERMSAYGGGNVVINLDGEEIFSKAIDKYNQEQVVEVGGR